MKPTCIYLNNTLFTENSIPFQLSDEEEILYFHRDTQFYLRLGSGIPIETEIYKASGGYLFLTSYRLIYKTIGLESSGFESFCLPLKEIVSISEDNKTDFVYGTFVQSIYLDLCDAQKTVFFKVLSDLLKEFNSGPLFEEEVESLPFYSDVYKP